MTIALKTLLQARHLQSHTDFKAEYEQHTKEMDSKLAGEPPTKAQYYNWLAGKLNGLPRGHHCRVLERMFPGWTAERLFTHTDPSEVLAADEADHEVSRPSNNPALEEFLGEDIVRNGVTLVYPTFELGNPARKALHNAGIPRQLYYQKSDSAFTASHRIDVPIALAENDVRALVYSLSMLQRHTNIQTDIENDHNVVAACDRSYISFGLSSNDCTHMYLTRNPKPMFSIKDDDESESYLEYIATGDAREFRSTDDMNIGMIMRTRPDPELHPNRYWFYCAGLGPRGTSGASWFLGTNWRALHRQVGPNDFVAILKVYSYSDQTAHLEHLYMGSNT